MMRAETPRQPRLRPLRRVARFFILMALPFGLGGCLVHLPETTPAATVGVATVPTIFFAATPAIAPPPDAPAGRYTLGAVTTLAATDPRVAYAVPILGSNGRFVQIALRADELQEPSRQRSPMNWSEKVACTRRSPMGSGNARAPKR